MLRREPYRVLFPLAIVLVWAGVLHWFLLGIGVYSGYRAIFHAMTQIQGALTCFAFGFLLTFVPRRTGTSPVSVPMLVTACVAPVATAAFAWLEEWAVAQLVWCAALVALLVFIARRVRTGGAPQKMHASFVWVPISVGASLLAAFVAGFAAANHVMWLHDASAHVILQGLFTGLILGIGGLLLPALTQGQEPSVGKPEPARRRDRVAHALLAVVFFGSFALEPVSLRLAYAVRTAAVLVVIVAFMRLYRLPTQRGVSRWLLWVSGWMLPLGYALVAAFPQQRLAGLHVVFIGGFWLMAVTIGSHVALSHGGAGPRTRSWNWQLVSCAALLLVAVITRALINLDPLHVLRWMAIAAGCFLLATLPWLALVVPVIARRRATEP